MEPIPSEELQRYALCLQRAWRHAANGDVQVGLEELDLGLTWAETPPIDPETSLPESPEPWAEPLSALYRAALQRFVDEHREPGRPAPGEDGCLRAVLMCGPMMLETTRHLLEEAAALRRHSAALRAEAMEIRMRCAEVRRVGEVRRSAHPGP